MNSVFGENTVRFYHVYVRLPVCFRTCISLEEWLNEFYIYYVPRNDSDLSDKFTLTLTNSRRAACSFYGFFSNLLVFEFPVIHLFAFDVFWTLHLRGYDFMHEFIRTDLNDINLPDQRSMIKSREYIKCHWNQPINHSCTEFDSYRFESHKQDQNAQFLMTAYFVNWTTQQKEPQTKCFLLSLREVKSLWRNSIEMPLWIKKKWCTHDLIEWDKF